MHNKQKGKSEEQTIDVVTNDTACSSFSFFIVVVVMVL
jgi:hypothetical protein